MTAQAESIAQAVAWRRSTGSSSNDLVSLQKMLDHQLRSHGTLAYLFIHKGDEILAHTFRETVPTSLFKANSLIGDGQGRLQRIVSKQGDLYLDFAWPVSKAKRVSSGWDSRRSPIKKKVYRLWIQMSIFTLVYLCLAILGIRLFLRRVTHPLSDLTRATEQIDQGNLGARVKVKGEDQIGRLAGSFNRMAARVEEYTHQLEMKATELERSNHQAREFCQVVQQIGSSVALMRSSLISGSSFAACFPMPRRRWSCSSSAPTKRVSSWSPGTRCDSWTRDRTSRSSRHCSPRTGCPG